MPASFREVFGNAGVDEVAKPPGMIVPRGGSNIVRLVGGSDWRVDSPPTLKIAEIVPPSISAILGEVVSSVSRLLTPAALIDRPIDLRDSRFFILSDHSAPGRVEVKAINPRTPAAEATLRVAVFGQRKVKLSIRPVLTRNAQGDQVLHSKRPFVVKALVDRMNAVWTPQANVSFNLVSSNQVPIDDGVEIAKALRLKNPTAQLPSVILTDRFAELFSRFKDKNADITMFLVEKVGYFDRPGSLNVTTKDGVTDAGFGISFISDQRTLNPDLLAHEAGHILGGSMGPGGRIVGC
jgi:Metallo-peptidase family M12B Reprolysin-like